ncbi:MAG TPA: general secretion pathway protein GspB [Dokdonella sp.]
MSLILEALKKSEQQRRLGQAPTLASPVVAVRRRRSVLPLLGVLIAAAVGAGWWFAREPAPAPAVPAAGAPAASAPAPARAPAGGAEQKPPVVKLTRDAIANRRAERERQVATEKAAAGVPPAARTAANANAPTKPVTPPPATNARPAAAPPAAATPTAANAPRAAAPVAAPASSATQTAAAPSAPLPAAAPKPAAATPAEPPLPSIWDLPYASRKDIPDLALTMHVYASDPADRFVVVKGDRHVEGDDLGDGLVLKQIRPDGIVLEYKGQRFVYPRDGGR